MTRSMTWLLAGASLSLYAAAGAAMAAEPDQARAEAERDATLAPQAREKGADEPRRERREVRIYRHGDDGDGPRTMVLHRGEGRSDHLKAVLQLRPEQDAALKAFIAATSPAQRDHTVRFDAGVDKRSTLDRLAEMDARLSSQQAATRKRIDATRAFYAQLDARQKAAFDAMPMLMMVGPDLGPMLIPTPGPMPVRFELRRGGDNLIEILPHAPPPGPRS